MKDTFDAITRPSVPAMDALLNQPKHVLDHGFVRLVDYMGDDAAVVQAARVSYGKGTKTANDDRGLIRYLLRHWHTTPLEMCEIKLHCKMPVFVARQWIRHRTANVNEYSARYSILDREFYVPDADQIMPQSQSNKQGREGAFDTAQALNYRAGFRDHGELSFNLYDWMNDEGISREQSRMVLPMNTYTQWYWKVDLHNLLHFMRLRADPHAQWEIRQYANAICEIVEAWVPHVWEAFVDYRLKAAQFSRMEMELLSDIIRDADPHELDKFITERAKGMTKREITEFVNKIKAQPSI